MKRAILVFLVCFAAAATIDASAQKLARDPSQYPTNSSLSYRGVVLANFNAGDAADEIAGDFGSAGLWVYDNDVWHQITGANPEQMISLSLGAAGDALLADFGGIGLWKWQYSGYPGTWIQLSGFNPEGMFAVNDDNYGLAEAHVDFGSKGVWRYDYLVGWAQISGLNPYNGLRMDTQAPGWEQGCWSFPTVGVWRIYFSGSTPIYTQLTGTTTDSNAHASSDFDSATSGEELVMDFGALGLYYYNSTTWTQLSPYSAHKVVPVKFVGSPDYELLVDFNAPAPDGLWCWDYPNTWFKIMDVRPDYYAFCEPFDADGADSGDEEVAIAMTAGGIKLYDYSAGSLTWLVQNMAFRAIFMVRGNYYGRGFDSTLAIVFDVGSPQPGLWLHDGYTATFTMIPGLIPDSST